MGKFAWEGVTRSGQTLKGEMDAPTLDAVMAQLRRQGIQPGKVKERGRVLDIDINGFAPKGTT